MSKPIEGMCVCVWKGKFANLRQKPEDPKWNWAIEKKFQEVDIYHTKKDIYKTRQWCQTKKTTPHDNKQSCWTKPDKRPKSPDSTILPSNQQKQHQSPQPCTRTTNHWPMPLYKYPNLVSETAGCCSHNRVTNFLGLQPFPNLFKQPNILHSN